jgi:hypothetical protein
MKPKGSVLVLVCVVAALLALPAGGSAKAPSEVHPGRYLLTIELPESNGWAMSILAYDHRQVYLRAQRGFTALSYRAPGRVSSRRVEADFGTLGKIDLDLALKARGTGVPRLHGRCTGRSPYELAGRFHGSVEFTGEPHLASASIHRGKAMILRTFQHVCRPDKSKDKLRNAFKPEFSVFGARSHESGRTTSFEAVGISIESELLLGVIGAKVYERAGEVGIARSTAELVLEKELRFSKSGVEPERVWVKPPRPFLGKASYLKGTGEPPTWSGDLRVRVPGGGLVSLAGPTFDSTLCRPRLPEEFERCIPQVRELRGPMSHALDLYGSGSHSQPFAEARLSSLR